LPVSWTNKDFSSIDTLERIFQKRFVDEFDRTLSYMVELKGKGLADIDVWNQTQAYHGKKLSLIFCKSVITKATSTTSTWPRRSSAGWQAR
jgi:hypothetical protein